MGLEGEFTFGYSNYKYQLKYLFKSKYFCWKLLGNWVSFKKKKKPPRFLIIVAVCTPFFFLENQLKKKIKGFLALVQIK